MELNDNYLQIRLVMYINARQAVKTLRPSLLELRTCIWMIKIIVLTSGKWIVIGIACGQTREWNEIDIDSRKRMNKGAIILRPRSGRRRRQCITEVF
jgi:hypothetical protein